MEIKTPLRLLGPEDAFPGPWVEDANQVIVLNDVNADMGVLRRIVACVNACAGISTEELEQKTGIVASSIDAAAGLVDVVADQRDALLSALVVLLGALEIPGSGDDLRPAYNAAVEAITRAGHQDGGFYAKLLRFVDLSSKYGIEHDPSKAAAWFVKYEPDSEASTAIAHLAADEAARLEWLGRGDDALSDSFRRRAIQLRAIATSMEGAA